MKNTKLIFTLLVSILGITVVKAAPTSSLYANANYIEQGRKVTVTLQLNGVAAWNVKIISAGSTSGCDASFADATGNGANTTKYLTVTCNSTGVGQISFRATGDATSSDGQTSSVNLTKIVIVTTPREKDSNNYLKTIGVKGYTIIPEFNKDTLEYTVEVPSTVNKITIKGEKASSYSSITGLGEFEVNEGVNTLEVKVTSETGVERTYKVLVNVKDENPIEIKIDNNNYTIMKNAKTIEIPSTYEATTIKIKDIDVPAFYSETSKYTIVGVKDLKGTTHLAIYDKEKNEYRLYNENKSDQLLLFIEKIIEEKKGFVKSTITINKKTYEALKLIKDESFVIVYAMNITTGKKNYYIYETEQNTFAKYNENIFVNNQKEQENYKQVIMILSGAVVFLVLVLTILLLRKPKNKKARKEEIKVNMIETTKKTQEELLKTNKKIKSKKNNEELEKEVALNNEDNNKEILQSSEDAVKKVDDATKIIEEFEKTIKLSKIELEQTRNERKDTKEIEATMYDIFSDDNKKKKKRK